MHIQKRPSARAALKFEYRPSKLILEQQLAIKQSLYVQLRTSLTDAHAKFTNQHKLLHAFQCQMKKKGFTEKLLALETANDVLRVSCTNTDGIQELFGAMYGKISEIFQRKNEDYKSIFEKDEKTDLVLESITSNSIILSEAHLEIFNNLKPLEINILELLKSATIVDNNELADESNTNPLLPKKITIRRSIATQTTPPPPKPKPEPTVEENSAVTPSSPSKRPETGAGQDSADTGCETETSRDYRDYVPCKQAHKSTSTLDMCYLLESKAVAAENATLVHKNAMLVSHNETQHQTISKLQALVDKLQEDCKEQRATIAMHQRTLRVRCDVLDSFTSMQSLSPKCCLADLFSDEAQSVKHMQFEISARTEEMSNLFSTLSEKHRCVLKQQQTIEKLQVTNQLQVNRISQLERDVAAMQVEMSKNRGGGGNAGGGQTAITMGDGSKKEGSGNFGSPMYYGHGGHGH